MSIVGVSREYKQLWHVGVVVGQGVRSLRGCVDEGFIVAMAIRVLPASGQVFELSLPVRVGRSAIKGGVTTRGSARSVFGGGDSISIRTGAGSNSRCWF